MTHDVTEWTATFSRSASKVRFFTRLFAKLTELGFTLENPDAIVGGYRLEFVKGPAFVMVDRYAQLPVAGETHGVSLYHDSDSWEAVFNALTPFQIVAAALEHLIQEDES